MGNDSYNPEEAERAYWQQKRRELSPFWRGEERRSGEDRRSECRDDWQLATDRPDVLYHVYGPNGIQEQFGPNGTYELIRPAEKDNDNGPKAP